MATYIKAGTYQVPRSDEQIEANIYIDARIIQVLDSEEDLVIELTYEELRGIMAIMAAEQEKTHLRIQALGRNN
jgi:hypothetical protein